MYQWHLINWLINIQFIQCMFLGVLISFYAILLSASLQGKMLAQWYHNWGFTCKKALREKCERVIVEHNVITNWGFTSKETTRKMRNEHVSTVFSDGKESGNVSDLFFVLHLSDKHSMKTVLDFSIPVASEYTARKSQKAMTTYHISNELKLKIGILGEERHEVQTNDDEHIFEKDGYKSE